MITQGQTLKFNFTFPKISKLDMFIGIFSESVRKKLLIEKMPVQTNESWFEQNFGTIWDQVVPLIEGDVRIYPIVPGTIAEIPEGLKNVFEKQILLPDGSYKAHSIYHTKKNGKNILLVSTTSPDKEGEHKPYRYFLTF